MRTGLVTCDRLIPKCGGWWRCGRAATVRSDREQVGHPDQRSRIFLCKRHERHAFQKAAAPWVIVRRVTRIYPRARAQ